MSDWDFLDLIWRVREAQKRYFKRRENLEECLSLERQLDAEISRRRKPELFPRQDEGASK